MEKIKKAFKDFFTSWINELKKDIKDHWLKYTGYIISFLVPLTYLFATYLEKKPESWALPTFVWIPVIIFILVYWFKLRTYLAIKVNTMQIQNDLERGKHAAAIIIIKTIQVIMIVVPFLLLYYVFDSFAKLSIQIQNIFLFLSVCEAVGGLFVIIDAITNVTKDSDNQ